MKYNTEDLFEQAIAVIDDNKLFFVEDVVAHLGIVKSTFYEHFPVDSDHYSEIHRELQKQKVRVKVSLRGKMHKSDSPTAWMALYKLVCTDKERKALSMEYIDHTTDGEPLKTVDITEIVVVNDIEEDDEDGEDG